MAVRTRDEVVNVDEVLARPLGGRGQRGLVGPVRPMRVFQPDDRRDALGMAIGEVVDRQHSEIEPGEDRAVFAEMVEQPGEVADNVFAVVLAEIGRGRGAAHAAHIGRDDAPPRRSERADLPMPAEPGVREAVTQHQQSPFALLDVVHRQAVDGRVTVRPSRHQKK